MPRRVPISIALCGLLVCAARCDSADWPHWRGLNRNGIVDEDSRWDSGVWKLKRGGPGKPLWNRNVGSGCTSPLVVGERLYTMGWSNKRDTLWCLDAATGEPVWQVSYNCPKYGRRSTGDKGIYAGITSTPEYDAETGYLYSLSVDGDLNCWNTAATGKKVWGFNLYQRYNVKRRPEVAVRRKTLRDYGYTSSPLVRGHTLIVEVGDDEGNLMGYDKRTGKRLWVSEAKEFAGHSGGPVLMTVEGVPCAAVLTIRGVLVVRLDKGKQGKTVAEFKWTTDFANNIPTLAVHENFVIVTSAYNQHAICKIKVTLKGGTKVWEQPLASGVCSPIIHKGYVYWAWRGVHCLDFETGKQQWQGGNVASAGSCILTSDERLIVWANQGDLTLVETVSRSSSKYSELAKFPKLFRRDAWPNVVLSNGRLFCKDRDGNVVCFGLD